MISLRVEHHRVFIEEADSQELAFLKKSLKIYSPLFNPPPGHPPFTTINLYYKDPQSFPTGYLSTITKKLEEKGLEVTIKDNRVYPRPNLKFHKAVTADEDDELWDHQVEALNALQPAPVGVISFPTGTGKTKILEKAVIMRGVKTLVIVPTRSIQMQVYNLLRRSIGKQFVSYKIPKRESTGENPENLPSSKTGSLSDLYSKNQDEAPKRLGSGYEPSIGKKVNWQEAPIQKKRLGSSYAETFFPKANGESPEDAYYKKKGLTKDEPWKKPGFKKEKKPKSLKASLGADITVVCFQSLPEADPIFLNSVECVMIDEYHHSSATTIREALDHMPKAAYRYGFSATPWRDKSDEKKLLLAALGDNIIIDLSGEEALERNIIAKPIYKVIGAPTPDEYLMDYTNWRMIVEKGLIGNAQRNKSIIKHAIDLLENDHNVFICVDEIAHLEILKKRFEEKGIEALAIHGQQANHINDANIKKVGSTPGGIISIGTMAVGEGTDMPNISAIILASGGKASIRFIQRIGRGTRLLSNKTEVVVIDFDDWFNRTLMKHSRARQKTFKRYFGSK